MKETPAGDHLFLLPNAAVVFYLCVFVSFTCLLLQFFFTLLCSNIMREYLYQIVSVRVPPCCVYMVLFFYFIGWRCRWVDLNNHSAINWANRLDSIFEQVCSM